VLALLILPAAAAIKLWSLPANPFLLLWALALSIPWAFYHLFRAHITDNAASIEIDQRFRLDERMSSAWILKDRLDPMVELLKEDASRHATGLCVGERFPIEIPRTTPAAGVLVALFCAVCLWLPALPDNKPAPALANQEPKVSEKKADEIAKLLKKREDLAKKNDSVKPATGTAALEDPLSKLAEKLQHEKLSTREAMAALSDGEKKLREKQEKLERIAEARSRLSKKMEDQKFTKEARDALSSGNYQNAAKAMEALSEKLGSSNMSSAEMKQMSHELESLASDLAGNQELAQALRDAAKELKASEGGQGALKLSAEQMKKIQSALAAASGNLAELQNLASRGNEIKSLLKDVDLAKLALCNGIGQCKACGKICSGTMCAKCCGNGSGMGGPGRGRGNQANPYEKPDVGFQDENVTSAWHQGRILGVVETEAEQSPAVSTLGDSVAFIEAGAKEQAVVQEEIPPGYENIVKTYFDQGQ
jgi:hypothetical protein